MIKSAASSFALFIFLLLPLLLIADGRQLQIFLLLGIVLGWGVPVLLWSSNRLVVRLGFYDLYGPIFLLDDHLRDELAHAVLIIALLVVERVAGIPYDAVRPVDDGISDIALSKGDMAGFGAHVQLVDF